jgi:hypothetical protein
VLIKERAVKLWVWYGIGAPLGIALGFVLGFIAVRAGVPSWLVLGICWWGWIRLHARDGES